MLQKFKRTNAVHRNWDLQEDTRHDHSSSVPFSGWSVPVSQSSKDQSHSRNPNEKSVPPHNCQEGSVPSSWKISPVLGQSNSPSHCPEGSMPFWITMDRPILVFISPCDSAAGPCELSFPGCGPCPGWRRGSWSLLSACCPRDWRLVSQSAPSSLHMHTQCTGWVESTVNVIL